LTEAMRTAANIRPGRALYYEAQAAIGDWQAELDRIATARARRAAQRLPSTQRENEPLNPTDALRPLLLHEMPDLNNKAPQFEPLGEPIAPPSLPPAPPQRAQRSALPVEPENPSPFVLEENTPLFEDAAPATDRHYDMDDVPRLINRGARRQRPSASSQSSSAPEQAPVEAVTPSQNENPFPSENLSPLFEPESSPLSESAPPVTAPVPLVEESPPPATEASSLERSPATESSRSDATAPLSMDIPKPIVPSADLAAPEPVSQRLPDKEVPLLPLSMGQAQQNVQL
jgi:hypothetical protein